MGSNPTLSATLPPIFVPRNGDRLENSAVFVNLFALENASRIKNERRMGLENAFFSES